MTASVGLYCFRRHKYVPLDHFYATMSISTLLTVTFKWTIHRESYVDK